MGSVKESRIFRNGDLGFRQREQVDPNVVYWPLHVLGALAAHPEPASGDLDHPRLEHCVNCG